MTLRRTILKSAIVAAGLAVAGLNAAAADELETLKEKGVIRIAMSGASVGRDHRWPVGQ